MIIYRNYHSIFRKNISKNALKVLYRLNKAGYQSYLVGGSVRDLLLGIQPKDFDITTSATPEQMLRLFRNCRLVGRRFILAHVFFGKEIIEVATFRGNHHIVKNMKRMISDTIIGNNGILLRDNIFGSIEEDAHRRDFSLNSLYYNIADLTLRDYTGGLKDLREGTIRLIGDPETRYREDPVRMLRAIRFASKLDMTISMETADPIYRLSTLLNNISPERLFEEALKLLQTGHGQNTYNLLCEYKLFQILFPIISSNFTKHKDSYMEKMMMHLLDNTDHRLRNNRPVNPAFLFSTILWYPLLKYVHKLIKYNHLSYFEACSIAINHVINEQCRTLAIPKRLTMLIKNMWKFQLLLSHSQNKHIYQLIKNTDFNLAYEFLSLRAEIENNNNLKNFCSSLNKFNSSLLIDIKK